MKVLRIPVEYSVINIDHGEYTHNESKCILKKLRFRRRYIPKDQGRVDRAIEARASGEKKGEAMNCQWVKWVLFI